MYDFIVNPNARTGAGRRIWEQVRTILTEEGIPYRVHFTGVQSPARELASAVTAAGKPCTIVVLGGDGTVNEVLQGLTHPELVTLGYIPIGSGNDFARDHQLPSDPQEALDNILHPSRTVLMDICELSSGSQTRRFAGSSGIGFDAAICHEALNSPIKNFLNRFHLGKFTYVGIALSLLRSFQPFPLILQFDGKDRIRLSKACFVCCMNLPYEGGGLKLAPAADGSDGMLDVCMINGLPKLLLLLLLPGAFFGKHVWVRRYVRIRRCRSVVISSAVPLPVHADGESFGHQKRLTARTLGQNLRVIAGPFS